MIELDIDLSYLTRNFNIGLAQIQQYAKTKSIKEIVRAEAEKGNKAAADFELEVLRDPKEVAKLCAFVKNGEITREIIDKACVKAIEASVFDLSAKVINGDTAGAMKLLDELYYMNSENIIIFHNISSAFVDMYRAHLAKSEGKNPEALADSFRVPANRAWLLRKAAGNLRKFDEKKLRLSFEAILRTERELKSYSSSGRHAIEKLVVRLIYIMKTGEALD